MKIKKSQRMIIYQGTSIEEFNEIQDSLANQMIKYDTKVVSREDLQSITMGQEIGAPKAENMDLSNIYTVYIHEKDLEKAREALL